MHMIFSFCRFSHTCDDTVIITGIHGDSDGGPLNLMDLQLHSKLICKLLSYCHIVAICVIITAVNRFCLASVRGCICILGSS